MYLNRVIQILFRRLFEMYNKFGHPWSRILHPSKKVIEYFVQHKGSFKKYVLKFWTIWDPLPLASI